MYLVLFRNRKRTDFDAAAYGADAGRMDALARDQPGFLSFKSYAAEDGEVVAISEWADEPAARAWAKNAEHAEVQARGRSDYYAEYTLLGCDNPRIHRFEAGKSPARQLPQTPEGPMAGGDHRAAPEGVQAGDCPEGRSLRASSC